MLGPGEFFPLPGTLKPPAASRQPPEKLYIGELFERGMSLPPPECPALLVESCLTRISGERKSGVPLPEPLARICEFAWAGLSLAKGGGELCLLIGEPLIEDLGLPAAPVPAPSRPDLGLLRNGIAVALAIGGGWQQACHADDSGH